MAFNLYFAGSRQKELEMHLISNKCCRLFSQYNERKDIEYYGTLDKDAKPKLFVDSGAFSVAHSGAVIDVDEYINFINESKGYVDVFAQLDSIPYPVLNSETAKKCSEDSWANYLYMVDKVDCPEKLLPLYHFGEPKENLKRILNTPIDALGGKPAPYIGIGGRHGVTSQQQLDYFQDIFNMIKKSSNPNVKVHAFGMTVLDILEQFPFYSADSTSYLKFAIYGFIVIDKGYVVSVSDRQKVPGKSYHTLPESAKQELKKVIESRGYTIEELTDDVNARLKFNVDFYKEWADNYQYKPASVVKKRLI